MAPLPLVQLPVPENPVLPEDTVFAGIPGKFGIVLYDADVFLAWILEVHNEEGKVLVDFFASSGRTLHSPHLLLG